MNLVKTFYLFSRPHAFIGTLIQALALVLISIAAGYQISALDFLISTISILLIHLYGMGINQIADVEIDKVNKPFLPIPSGYMSIKQATLLTSFCGISALFFAFSGPQFLFSVIFILGVALTLYSVPPFQLKQNPWSAGLTIALSRSIIYSGGFLIVYSKGLILSHYTFYEILFVSYIFLHAFIFAISKDIPDISGDKKFNIKTFASKFGEYRLVKMSVISMISLMLMLVLFTYTETYFYLFVISQIFLSYYVFRLFSNYKKKANSKTLVGYYIGLWKLYYFQLFVFVAAAWIG